MIQTIIQSFHQTWSSASLDSDHTAAILLVTIIDVVKKAPAAQTGQACHSKRPRP